ncbi:MAG: phage portal protein [Bilophila wadsworthia]
MRAALVVGNGIRLQAYYGAGKASATLDAELNEAVESAFERWCEQADFSGRLHFYDMQALAERQLLECGEYFFIRRFDRGRYALQGIEGDRLHRARRAGGGRQRAGRRHRIRRSHGPHRRLLV